MPSTLKGYCIHDRQYHTLMYLNVKQRALFAVCMYIGTVFLANINLEKKRLSIIPNSLSKTLYGQQYTLDCSR